VARGVRLLFDAEQTAIQPGIDDWTLAYMQKYNRVPGRAAIYGTYQAYLKSTPATLRQHFEAAKSGGFTLGVKLVRGAYLGSDPRDLIHDTKENTDTAYDGIAESILRRQWGDVLVGEGEYPLASLVLASHNIESVRRARQICQAGESRTEVAFAQLQGMADEVSCELVSAAKIGPENPKEQVGQLANSLNSLQTYKYIVWGTTGECMKYLLRRAQENKDAVQRTINGRNAMWGEVVRRLKRTVGVKD
jgi:proline dehydrogenase